MCRIYFYIFLTRKNLLQIVTRKEKNIAHTYTQMREEERERYKKSGAPRRRATLRVSLLGNN